MRDDVDLDKLSLWGHPWHGVVNAGTLTTTVGGVERPYTQPDWGDCWLVKAPDVAEVIRTPDQLEVDAAAGAEWRNYALMTGWYTRQLYSKQMSAGADSNKLSVYLPKSGYGWSVRANLSAAGVALSGDMIFSRLMLGSTEQQTVAIDQAVTWPFSTGAYWDMVARNADGTKMVIGLWSAAAGLATALGYSHEFPKHRARAKVDPSTTSGDFAVYYSRVLAPFQYVLLTIAGGTDEIPGITVTPSILYTFDDTETIIKDFYNSIPFPLKNLYLHYDGANYQYELLDVGSSPGVGYSLVEGSVPLGDGQFQHETESIVGVYFDLTTGDLKTVKVKTTATSDENWSYDLGSASASPGTFTRTFAGSGTGKIALLIDGTEVSKVEASDTWSVGEELDSSYSHVSDIAGSTTGTATIDGTSIYSETKTLPGITEDVMGIHAGAETRKGFSGQLVFNNFWLRIDAHGMEYCSGAFGLVLDLNPFVPVGGVARTVVAGGVTSVVTQVRGATIGVVSTSGGYINYVYENIKFSHHPVTGDMLMNAGSWV